MKWEYMLIRFNANTANNNSVIAVGSNYYQIAGTDELLIKKINEFGAQGWEMTGTLGTLIYFKRVLR